MDKYEVATIGSTGIPKTLGDELVEGGMPVFYADQPLSVVVSPECITAGTPQSCTDCGIALGVKRAFGSPFVLIGASHAYVALPAPAIGKHVPGFRGKWAVFAFETSTRAGRRIIEHNDLSEKDRDTDEATVVQLRPFRPSERCTGKATKNARNEKRAVLGRHKSQPGKPRMQLEQGVRNYSGRSWKSA